jgi:site-specific DNA-methyltransferase (adenine-specific)
MPDQLWTPSGPDLVVLGDNLAVTAQLPDASFRLIYLDPPFNTGRTQSRQTISTRQAVGGSRVGFKGQTYATVKGTLYSYNDEFADYWDFPNGTLYLHLDYREVHYAKVALDALFGRDCFLNEIIWAYDYGAKSGSRWPAKHDTILVYVKDPKNYYFDNATVDREPYMAPGLVTAEKVARGKLPTDVWWHTIVGTNGRERTGYATQKPEGILRRIIQASSAPGDWVLDFFAGSGTTASVARQLDRRFVAVDANPDAVEIMRKRLGPDVAYVDTIAS